jgi:hypothetical protein
MYLSGKPVSAITGSPCRDGCRRTVRASSTPSISGIERSVMMASSPGVVSTYARASLGVPRFQHTGATRLQRRPEHFESISVVVHG